MTAGQATGPFASSSKTIYGDDAGDRRGLDDEELIELGQNLRRGVPIATPVFDGAKEADIEDMLRQGRASITSGQVTLYDGRTGEPSTAR